MLTDSLHVPRQVEDRCLGTSSIFTQSDGTMSHPFPMKHKGFSCMEQSLQIYCTKKNYEEAYPNFKRHTIKPITINITNNNSPKSVVKL